MSGSMWLGLRALFQRRALEREMDAEMSFHLEMETQKNERLGMSRAEARRQAILVFGGVERHQESMRDGRGVRLLEDLVRDLRYAARALLHNPGFTLAAVLTLALAIGTNSAVFSVVNGLIIRPFPVAAPDGLVALWNTNPADGGANQLGYDDYVDWRERSGIFASLAAQMNAPLSLSEGGGAEVVWSEIVSSNYFATLGLRPHLGRFFAADEAVRPGAAPYAVLGYDLWQRQFAGDRTVVGRVVRVNRGPVEVIGVAPRSFHGIRRFGFWSELWIPFGAPGTESLMQGRGGGPLMIVGRLPDGVDRQRAQARASVFARGLSETFPATNRDLGALLTSARTPFDSPRWVPPRVLELAAGLGLFGVGLILLVACANVANLLLARASARQREMAVRLSIGSGRSRLIRQLLTESALLSLLGGLLALPIAALAERWQGAMLPRLMFKVGLNVSMDQRVLAFTAFMTLLAVFLFGLVPALQATRLDLATALRNGSGRARGRRFELRNVLVAVQIAVSVILLIAGSLFTRSLHATSQVELGLEPANRIVISANPESFGYDPARARNYFRSAAQRVRELPGVTNAAWGFPVPFDTYNRGAALYVQGVTENRDNQTAGVGLSTIDPRFFETVGTTVVSGREFTLGDTTGAPRVMVITQATAELFWPGRNALGQRVRMNGPTGAEVTVVGVIENVVFASLSQQHQPFIFLPNDQSDSKTMGLSLIVQVRNNAEEYIARVRSVLQSTDAEVATYGAITMQTGVRNAMNVQFSAATVAGTLAVLALVLALVGLYGVVAYTVARSTREIGIRVALGARPASIIRLFMTNMARTTAIGLAFGLAGAFAIGRTIASVLYGVSGSDPLTFVVIPLALALVAGLASYLPARRATRVPPVLSLRQD